MFFMEMTAQQTVANLYKHFNIQFTRIMFGNMQIILH